MSSNWKIIKEEELLPGRSYMVNCPKWGKIHTKWDIHGLATKLNWGFIGVDFKPTHYFDVPDFNDSVDLIPAWFTDRMTSDEWCFALVTVDGCCYPISSIHQITKDDIGDIWITANWLDNVALVHKDHPLYKKMIPAPTSRDYISLNSRNIISAFEIADT